MRTIWKQQITVGGLNEYWLPDRSEIIFVDKQDDDPNHFFIWFEAHNDNKPVMRSFHVYGTGFQIRDGDSYVGSVVYPVAGLVWHLYEEK